MRVFDIFTCNVQGLVLLHTERHPQRTTHNQSWILVSFWIFEFLQIKVNLLLSKKQGKPVVERVQWFCGIPRQPACRPSALYKMISREFQDV